jgi:hypothetical protein
MPPNPPNLLNESTESAEDNGVTLPLVPNDMQQNPSIAKPISDVNMGVEGQDESAEMQGGAENDDVLSDEDHDMSDGGGAPLTMTLSHAEALNAELDMLDAEVMGTDNLYDLHMGQYQGTMIEDLPISYYGPHHSLYNFVQDSDVYDEDIMDLGGGLGPGQAASPNLPIAMSAVSQQLQHIQDGQGHANFTAIPDAQHGGIQDNSTLSLPFHPPFSTITLDSGNVPASAHISLASVSSSPQQAVTLGSPNAPHPWGTGGWTPSPAMDVVLVSAQGHSTASQFLSSYIIGLEDDDTTETDNDPVDDQINLSLSEFLYNWAHSSLREEDAKKRPRGPTIAAVESQRELKTTEPLLRSDLRGDRCDIQRINWAELGVSRLEARQMRRQTYKNYTNLRLSLQWHVSIKCFLFNEGFIC